MEVIINVQVILIQYPVMYNKLRITKPYLGMFCLALREATNHDAILRVGYSGNCWENQCSIWLEVTLKKKRRGNNCDHRISSLECSRMQNTVSMPGYQTGWVLDEESRDEQERTGREGSPRPISSLQYRAPQSLESETVLTSVTVTSTRCWIKVKVLLPGKTRQHTSNR